ncbi:MAG: hypothetical protein PHY47_21245 [Lachnospiraceae bacterium]|nr:hypothetical protein [Lachnospiraceae bacterium]
MKINGWKYYNRAAIPTTTPHEKVDLNPIEDKSIWKMDGKPLFARWTENYDCSYETDWWYCIKDEPFHFEQIKSKRRTEIRKGLKINRVEIIKASDYIKEIYKIQSKCYNDYPEQYRPEYNYDIAKESCKRWDEKHIVFMAFSVETGEATGFACVEPINDYVNFEILKVPNEYKNSQVVTALTYEILLKMINEGGYKYVCDGARNLVHQTNFMDYLVKQFAFRYAYCDLKMAYRTTVKPIVYILYPFRNIIRKFSDNRLLYNIFAVLKMEEISRKS